MYVEGLVPDIITVLRGWVSNVVQTDIDYIIAVFPVPCHPIINIFVVSIPTSHLADKGTALQAIYKPSTRQLKMTDIVATPFLFVNNPMSPPLLPMFPSNGRPTGYDLQPAGSWRRCRTRFQPFDRDVTGFAPSVRHKSEILWSRISVCTDDDCVQQGAIKSLARLKEEAKTRGVEVREVVSGTFVVVLCSQRSNPLEDDLASLKQKSHTTTQDELACFERNIIPRKPSCFLCGDTVQQEWLESWRIHRCVRIGALAVSTIGY